MRYRPAYTLVELLIVITIVGVIITVGAGAYSRAQRRQAVKGATETILTTLQRAQKMSVIGDKDCTGSLVGYQVNIVDGEKQISSTAVCDSSSGTTRVSNLDQITFQNTATFLFRPLGDGVYLGGGASANVDYSLDSDTTTYRITIDQSGIIRYSGTI